MLTSPHHTEFSVFSSNTTKRSFGDLPVNSPVSIAIAPVSVKTPCPLMIVSSTNSAGVKFQNTFPKLVKPIESFKLACFPRLPNSFIRTLFYSFRFDLGCKITPIKFNPQFFFLDFQTIKLFTS